MMHRFGMFVDGSNLFGILQRINLRIDDYEALFRLIFESAVRTWKSTFDGPVLSPQLHRVKWYEVGSLDEWNLTDMKAQSALRDLFERDKDLKRSYTALASQKMPDSPPADVTREAWTMCLNDARQWYDERRNLVDGFRRFHYAIRSGTNFIDVVECGHWKLDLLHRSAVEKGLDTRLAVDMVTLIDNYDVALLVSGDADNIPGLDYVRSKGRHVGVIEFLPGASPAEKKGVASSSRLKIAADFVVQIYEKELVDRGLAKRRVDPALANGA